MWQHLRLIATLLPSLLLSLSSVYAAVTDRFHCRANQNASGWNCVASGTNYTNEIPETYQPINSPISAPIGQPPQSQPAVEKQPYLDWVARDQLTPLQQATLPPYCRGAYVEPDYVSSDERQLDPSTQPVIASAERSAGSLEGRSTMVGQVVIQQGNRLIEGNEASFSRAEKSAEIAGDVLFREPGMLLIGRDAKIQLDTKEVTVQDAEFIAHENEMRGEARQLELKDNIVYIDAGRFTRCEPGVESWSIQAGRLRLNQESGIGTAKHATLRVRKIPVLYTPYIQFPIDDRRKSGVLFPTLGSSSDGADIAVPYYINLAPNYDATFTPRFISERGPMADLEFRYLHKTGRGVFSGGFLEGDEELFDEDRWRAQFQHRGTYFNLVNTLVNYSTVSDEDYFSDFGSGLGISSQTYLPRLGQASINGQFASLTTKLIGYQILDENLNEQNLPYDQLPQIRLQLDFPHETSGLELGLDARFTYFDRENEDLLLLDEAATVKTLNPAVGSRVNLIPSIGWNLEKSFAYLRPKIQYKYIGYQLQDIDNSLENSPEVGTPVYSLDSGVFFERNLSFAGQSLIHTFEPRLFYLKVPREDQSDFPDFDTSIPTFSYNQLFRDNRFIGGDRIGDTEQLSIGITTRFLDESGFEPFRASVGQIYYFEDRGVTLVDAPGESEMQNESAYAAEFLIALNAGWRLRGNLEWDPNSDETNENSISLRYRSDNRHIFNLGYRARWDRQEIEQTNIGLIWPLSPRWSFIARWNQDIINDRVVDALAGLEYQTCCWSVRLVGRQWINDEDLLSEDGIEEREAVYFQIQLRGLAGVGDTLEGVLQDSIAGYRERDDNDFR